MGNQQPQWKPSVWLILAKQRMGRPLSDGDHSCREQLRRAEKTHCIPEGTASISPCPCTPCLPPRPRSGPPDWRWPYAPSAGQRVFSSACNHPGPPSTESPGWRGRDDGLPEEHCLVEGRLTSSQHFMKQHHAPAPQLSTWKL